MSDEAMPYEPMPYDPDDDSARASLHAAQRITDPSAIQSLLGSPAYGMDTLQALAGNPALTPAQQEVLVAHTSSTNADAIPYYLAQNTALTPSLQRDLAQSPFPHVVAALAGNPSLTPDLCASLALHPNSSVQVPLAINPALPPAVAIALATHSDIRVRHALARRLESLPLEDLPLSFLRDYMDHLSLFTSRERSLWGSLLEEWQNSPRTLREVLPLLDSA